MSEMEMLPPPEPARRKSKGGRPFGSVGYFSRSARLMLEQAFESVGGMDAFVRWGKSNPTEFYKLWSKLLPQNLNVPTTLDSARALLAQLEDELGLPPTELNLTPIDGEFDDDPGDDGPLSP